jgi:hypothetical protein
MRRLWQRSRGEHPLLAVSQDRGHASAAAALDTDADLFHDDADLVADALDDARALSID